MLTDKVKLSKIIEFFDTMKRIGIHGRFPIYYIDEYPNPYTYYKLSRKRGEFILEGVLSE